MAPVSVHSGYWGLPTATMDWCEQNYEVSIFWGVRVSKILTFGLVKSVQNLLQTTITTHVHNLRVNKIVLWYHTSPQVTWYVAEFWNTISNLAMIGTSISNSTCKKTKILIKFTKEFETHKPIHSACMQWDPEGEEGELREKASMM